MVSIWNIFLFLTMRGFNKILLVETQPSLYSKEMRVVAAVLGLLSICCQSYSQLEITFQNSGPDLIVTASGNLDVSGSTYATTTGEFYSYKLLQVHDLRDRLLYTLSASDVYFIGTSGSFLDDIVILENASVASGDSFGLEAGDSSSPTFLLYVPEGFTSGFLLGSMTFSNLQVEDVSPIEQTVSWGGTPEQSVIIRIAEAQQQLAKPTIGFSPSVTNSFL
jgi:hypothetical protein